MEVHCESCPAKYAVPDDKVRGKKVRIKCKHCGSPIVVDGTTLGGSPSAAPKPKASSLPAAKAQPVVQPAPKAVTSPQQPARVAAGPKPAPAAAPAPQIQRPAAWREPAQPSPAASPPAASSAWREPAAIPARGIKSTMLGIPPPAAASAPSPAPAPAPAPAAPAAQAAARAAKPTLLGGLDGPAAVARAAVSAPRPEPAPSPPRSVKRTMLGIPAPAGELPLKPEPARSAPTEPAPPPEPARGAAEMQEGAEAEWTVAVTDEQHEEMTTAQVIRAYAGGEIGDDTFIWAEGMDDWKNPFEIPLLAAELASRGYGPGSGVHDEDQTVITEAPSESVPPGVWREPGSWRGPALGDADSDEPSDVSFDDVTVSMDSSKAQELLRAAGADDAPAPARGLGDTLIDDATHDDVTLAVDSRPFFAESAPIANRGRTAPSALSQEDEAPLDWDEDPTTAMEAPGSTDSSRMTGARNEDSVLFSLDALAQSQRAPAAQQKPRAEDDFLLAKPDPLPPMPAPIPLEAPPMPPPPPQFAQPQMPAAPAIAPAPPPFAAAAPAEQLPTAPRSHPPSAVAAIASAPIAPHSVAPRRASRAWLWILLFLMLAGGALAASYYFKQPARVWQVLDPMIHPQSAAPAPLAPSPAPPQPSAAPAPATAPPAAASGSGTPAADAASAAPRAP